MTLYVDAGVCLWSVGVCVCVWDRIFGGDMMWCSLGHFEGHNGKWKRKEVCSPCVPFSRKRMACSPFPIFFHFSFSRSMRHSPGSFPRSYQGNIIYVATCSEVAMYIIFPVV